MVIGTALAWTNAATIALSIALAFVFGYALTLAPLLRAGLSVGAAFGLAFASDTVSIALMEIIDNVIMVVIPGAMDAGLRAPLFWGSLIFALAVAGVLAFPVNRWLISRGRGRGPASIPLARVIGVPRTRPTAPEPPRPVDFPPPRSTLMQRQDSTPPTTGPMRKLIVSEFVTLDGVMQAPGGKDEDTDGGFEYGGWTIPFWHDDIGQSFGELMQGCDAFLLGRRTYVTHAEAFEPLPPGDPFGDLMNTPKHYVVSKTLKKPIWRNTTIIRDTVIESVRALKAEKGGNILTDGSSQLVHALIANDLVDELHLLLYPITLGQGKRVLPNGVHAEFKLTSAKPYPTGVVGLHYVRNR